MRTPHRSTGFSLLEVLIALLVLGLLAIAVGQATFLSLQSELRSRTARETSIVLQQLWVDHWMDPEFDSASESIGPGWLVDDEKVDVALPDATLPGTLYQVRKDGQRRSVPVFILDRQTFPP